MTSLADAIASSQAIADQLADHGIPADVAGDPLHLGITEVPLTIGNSPHSLFLLLVDGKLEWELVSDADDETNGVTVEEGSMLCAGTGLAIAFVRRWIFAAGARPGHPDSEGGPLFSGHVPQQPDAGSEFTCAVSPGSGEAGASAAEWDVRCARAHFWGVFCETRQYRSPVGAYAVSVTLRPMDGPDGGPAWSAEGAVVRYCDGSSATVDVDPDSVTALFRLKQYGAGEVITVSL
ncbi:hypothetical protein LN042_23060 [Kitasatospora sp. RB6PN24]|uniref:hypothetical protein n=1 Tax=Kitasatospora humi TaxID=2893891 RepID=UPI001E48CE30|nr:hypothetical protein [Kitasatospora humi]MCC9309916.1 hypothetical protein [Kitasatospora humi]